MLTLKGYKIYFICESVAEWAQRGAVYIPQLSIVQEWFHFCDKKEIKRFNLMLYSLKLKRFILVRLIIIK
jgi:hypothetical protein